MRDVLPPVSVRFHPTDIAIRHSDPKILTELAPPFLFRSIASQGTKHARQAQAKRKIMAREQEMGDWHTSAVLCRQVHKGLGSLLAHLDPKVKVVGCALVLYHDL